MILERDRHILYVDSNEEQRRVMHRIFETAGFVSVEAASAAEAIQIFSSSSSSGHGNEILAMILDVALPDMSGYELCQRVKAHEATAGMPVVQILASVSDAPRRAAHLSGGADAYLSQPVQPTELLSLVDALIRAREVEKTLRFQAAVGARLTASLDYSKTLQTIESAFLPDFADRCTVVLCETPAPVGTSPRLDHHRPAMGELSDEVREHALQVCSTGDSRYIDSSTIVVPLEAGRRRLGALIFRFEGDRRRYTRGAVALAEDLADRAALALQNADLYTAQQTAQAALVQSEKLAAAGRLSAAIAHEINNPLEAITNLIFLIDTSEGTPPNVKAYAGEALSELSRLTHIARQSLGFYRELTGPASFDLNEGVEDTLNIYLKRFEAKHIAIERSYTEGLALVAVKGEIRQVISNLLVNAYDALPQFGRIKIETHGSDDDVCFRIADSGSGISDEILTRIFEPFFTTKENSGTGLGLWVSKEIVEKHGGRIEVESHTDGPAQGTAFSVILPRVLHAAA